jgi:hypothetical protein
LYENYITILFSIQVSLSKQINKGRWKLLTNRNHIDFKDIRITETNEIDISCLSEIRCPEFFWPISSKIDYSEYWITINIKDHKGALKHSKSGLYNSCFTSEK